MDTSTQQQTFELTAAEPVFAGKLPVWPEACACWSGAVYKDQQSMVRVDMLYLNVVSSSDGRGWFRRLVPRMIKSGGGFRKVVYTTEPLFKITSGERLRMVVTKRDLQPHETYHPAGYHKSLYYGTSASSFNRRRTSDCELLSLLTRLLRPTARASAEQIVPDLQLVCGVSEPSLRLRPTAKEWMRNNGIHTAEDFKQSGTRRQVSQLLSATRSAFPFEHVCGKGVVACPLISGDRQVVIGRWYRVPSLLFNLPHMECV